MKYGWNSEFAPGDRIEFMGHPGWVERVTVEHFWQVPVGFDAEIEETGGLHYINSDSLKKIESDPGVGREHAIIGDPSFSDVWQSTGNFFEVMFKPEDTFGAFYLREKSDERVTMEIDYVTNEDDWHAVYVNGDLWHEGHRIPDFVWVQLLVMTGVNISTWFSKFPTGRGEESFELQKSEDPHMEPR